MNLGTKLSAGLLALLLLAPAGGVRAAHVVVDAAGRGDFTSVQAAVDAAPAGRTNEYVIAIRPGVYRGPLIIPRDKPHLTLAGEAAHTTRLTYALNVNDPRPAGGDKFNPGVWVRADDFRAEGLTFENTAGDRGQALALRVDGDRAAFRACRMLGWQDTLMVNEGRHYFRDCHIEGRVDFIYGSATAVFDACRIHSKNGGYITAASTPAERPQGFVFLRCRLTGDPAQWVAPGAAGQAPARPPRTYLGRPWRDHASVAFIECDMDGHIAPAGWDNWRQPARERTARFMEYGSRGPGGGMAQRVAWARPLTPGEAAQITVAAVLGGADGWRPDRVSATRAGAAAP